MQHAHQDLGGNTDEESTDTLRFQTHIEKAMSDWFVSMGGHVEANWLEGMARRTPDANGIRIFTVGSMLTGSDIAFKILQTLSEFVERTYGLDIRFVNKFQFEHDPDKREHLKNHSRAEYLFVDTRDVGNSASAYEAHNQREEVVPGCDILTAGIPPASSFREGFCDVFAHMKRVRPRLTILEQVA